MKAASQKPGLLVSPDKLKLPMYYAGVLLPRPSVVVDAWRNQPWMMPGSGVPAM